MTRLTARTQGNRAVVVTRRFAAPPEKVWRALTENTLLRQWMATEPGELKSVEGQAVPGGSHHFVWDDQGKDMNMTATYDVLDAPTLLRYREAWPEYGFMESQVETRLKAVDGGTEMEMTITFASAEARDQAVASGMTDGMEATYANLDRLLEEQG